jgi:hypothetical protein
MTDIQHVDILRKERVRYATYFSIINISSFLKIRPFSLKSSLANKEFRFHI